jgi:hypothetical protein
MSTYGLAVTSTVRQNKPLEYGEPTPSVPLASRDLNFR